MSIVDLYNELKDNPSGHTYTARAIPSRTSAYLALNQAGQPSLFVDATRRLPDAPLRTSKVALRLSQEFVVDLGAGPRRQLLHSLSCESTENTDIKTFLLLVEAFLASGSTPSVEQEQLSSFFRSLVRLFAVVPARDLESERQGLWGELFVMRESRGFQFWAPFWHSETTRLFDFSCGQMRVEAKTIVGQERIHHFGHRQIFALAGEEILIASLLLREDDTGLSLRQLIEEARAALLGTGELLKLERAVRRVGMDVSDVAGPMYDPVQARTSLRWYRSDDAPHFRMPEPPGVSETRYKVDLSTAPSLSATQLEQWLIPWKPVGVTAVQIG